MEFKPLPPVNASKVPMATVHLPNTPVIALMPVPPKRAKKVEVHKTGVPGPKTKVVYGMTQPYKACINHGTHPDYLG
jgi:hypothetical protein